MKKVVLKSFAKINLSLDVKGKLENGYHEVDMVMQQLEFHDDITISFQEDKTKGNGEIDINLSTNKYYLPTDQRNLAYKASQIIIEKFGDKIAGGILTIYICKRIPVAAGLAGGSSNAAMVLMGLNQIWNLELTKEKLCEIGVEIGSDVPFCMVGGCARAFGTGIELEKQKPFKGYVVLAKPPMGVSTKEVYEGIDNYSIICRPNNDEMAKAIDKHDYKLVYKNMINVLELYTLDNYPKVKELKKFIEEATNPLKTMMTGSGPTIFAIYPTLEAAKVACAKLRSNKYEAYWTKTTK